jgi:hypothetical protein
MLPVVEGRGGAASYNRSVMVYDCPWEEILQESLPGATRLTIRRTRATRRSGRDVEEEEVAAGGAAGRATPPIYKVNSSL